MFIFVFDFGQKFEIKQVLLGAGENILENGLFGRIRMFAAQIFEIIKINKYQKTQDIGQVLIILV